MWLRRGLGLALAAAVLWLTVGKLREIDWAAVASALSGYGLPRLATAIGLILPALAACAGYDLIGRRLTRHKLSRGRTALLSFAGYFLSLNLGAIVGGLALRFRLYSVSGLRPLTTGQVIGVSVLTNWLGFVLIAGIVLVAAPAGGLIAGAPTEVWQRAIGAACLLAVGAWLTMCRLRADSRIRIRDTTLIVPGLPLGVLQICLSCTNWAASGTVIAWLLPGVSWLEVMPVLMLSALAGIWSHVPGGIGVTEAVFASLLGGRLPAEDVVAAVLVFRVAYYFLPLLLSLGCYAWIEAGAARVSRRERRH